MAKKKISGMMVVGVLAAAGLGYWYFTKKKKEEANPQFQKNTGSPVELKIKASEAGATGQQAPSGYGKM